MRVCKHGCDVLVSRVFCNGNRTEWRPIRSVIIQVITKSDEVLLPIIHKNYNFREKKTSQVTKERKILQ